MASIISAGTTSGTSLNLSGDTSGVLQLATNGSTTAVTIDTSQNVGIGTASPNALLTIAAASTDTRIRLVGRSADGTSAIRYYSSDNATQYGFLSFGNAYAEFNYNGSGYMGFATNNTERMRITSGGNVGIGNSSPNNTLSIQAGTASVRLDSSTGTNAVYSQFVNTGGSFYVGRDNSTGAVFGAAYASVLFSEGAYPMNFYTAGTERMRITSSGNVGIGTSSPSSKLVVSAATDQGIWVTDGTYTGTFNPTSLGGVAVGTNGAYPLILATNTSERMRIDSSGNVLVGTTSFSASSNGIQFGSASNSRILCTNNTDYNIELFGSNGSRIGFGASNSSSRVGSISVNTTNTSYNTSSDYRLKENIAPMTGALAKVQQLKPCTYTWKVDGSAGQGFIAHELQEIVPDAVTGEKDAVEEDGSIKPQQIDTSFLVATLTAAIQELKAELDATKAEVAALKGVN